MEPEEDLRVKSLYVTSINMVGPRKFHEVFILILCTQGNNLMEKYLLSHERNYPELTIM